MPRWPLALTLATALAVGPAAPADGAPERPSLCIAATPRAPRCHAAVTFEQGRVVTLHSSTPGAIWRSGPRNRALTRVGHTGSDRTWTWTPARRHVHPAAPYRFVLTAGRATSRTVEVWVVPRHG